jgi:hypothetical protein
VKIGAPLDLVDKTGAIPRDLAVCSPNHRHPSEHEECPALALGLARLQSRRTDRTASSLQARRGTRLGIGQRVGAERLRSSGDVPRQRFESNSQHAAPADASTESKTFRAASTCLSAVARLSCVARFSRAHFAPAGVVCA